jgi:hypothetical protein
MAKELDQEFVENVVKALVDLPDKVSVVRKIDERGVLLELTVDPSDMGKVVGRAGRTAKAIRSLLRVLGAKNNARLNLKIIEPEGSMRPTGAPRNEAVKSNVPAPAASEGGAQISTTKGDLEEIAEE